MLNIAHRGASGEFPENTLCAFAAALSAGADMCELDVRLTRDGQAVVFHDASVERTTNGHGALETLSLEEVKRLDAGAKFAAEFAGERVPTLAEVFDLAAGRCSLNLELKAVAAADTACALIRARDAVSATLVSGFDWPALRRLRQRAPEVRLGLLAERRARQLLAVASEIQAQVIAPRFDLVTADFCTAAHRRGIAVYTWTVDEAELMSRLIADGVDGIMTNYPARLTRLMAR